MAQKERENWAIRRKKAYMAQREQLNSYKSTWHTKFINTNGGINLMNAKQLLNEAYEIEEKLVEDRRYFHTYPEMGFDLVKTREYVKKELVSMGYEPVDCGKAGVIALVGGKKPGKVFMIRGDMDALPVQEESDVEFVSRHEGKMHACGHDMHTAMMLGAARLLKTHEDEIAGTVKLCFQPSEENFEGSHDMIQAGLLKNPHVDAALMIHVTAAAPMPAGTVIVCSGGVSAPAADYFTIRIQGKGCHGAMPQNGIDPITVAAHIIMALQELNARELAMADEAALTIGTIHAGIAENVIPDTAQMGGTLRTYDEETRAMLKERMREICSGIAKVFRASAEVEFTSGCPSLLNDKEVSESVTQYTKELLGAGKAFSMAEIQAMAEASNSKASCATGSEDFAYVSREVPAVMLALAAGQPEQGYIYPQHHPKVKFDETVLPAGSAVYAYTAMRWLEEHEK